MKIAVLIFTLLLTFSTLALEGSVIVLETPLFAKPDKNSTIVQYVRKNDTLTIHKKHAPPLLYEIYDEAELKELSDDNSAFFLTLDRLGRNAYVLKEHVKLIYKDAREFFDDKRIAEDPTDYRLAEPIPKSYPFQNNEKYKAEVSIGMGTSDKTNYPYPSTISEEDFSNNQLITISYSKKIPFDITDRLYFGIMTYYSQSSASFSLNNFTTTKEESWQFGLGPYLSYLAYKNYRFNLNFYGGITYARTRSGVRIKHVSLDRSLQRNFSGSLFKARLGLRLIHRFFPKVDLTLSTQLEATLPYKLTSGDYISAPTLWNGDNDSIEHSRIISASAMLGIIAYY